MTVQFKQYPLNTAVFARKNLSASQTVRKHYCLYGSFYGVRPLKLASGRLAWPDVVVSADGVKEAA